MKADHEHVDMGELGLERTEHYLAELGETISAEDLEGVKQRLHAITTIFLTVGFVPDRTTYEAQRIMVRVWEDLRDASAGREEKGVVR